MYTFCAVILTTLMLPPTLGHSSPCCFSASGLQSARLKMWETLAVGWSAAISVYVGTWTANGDFAFTDQDNFSEIGIRNTLWTLYRPAWRHTLSASVPTQWTFRSAGELSDTGGGMGDITVGYRYDLLTVHELENVPAIALTFGLTLPSGVSADASAQKLGADTTGKGTVVPSVGLVVEDAVYPWFWRVAVDLRMPLPTQRLDTGVIQTLGLGITTTVVAGIDVIPNDLLLSVGINAAWETPTQHDGTPIDDSHTQDLTVSASAAWRLDRHWTLQAGLDTGIFISGLGFNRPALITPTLGIRFGG
ncbi:MAG: hypothetical protein HUU55_10090 [Myxococcales bacterium]|nr:hypothetical protein [Myxococcales bacterium]